MDNTIPLKKITKYSVDKIDIKFLDKTNYITTDNMLQNKLGVEEATFMPPQDVNVTRYKKGDILIANIRPYLKKIWYASQNGGNSADVLTIQVNDNFDSKFVYYALFRDDFFEYVMKGAKGTKMPRGDKNQIMEFIIPNFDKTTQQKIASVLSTLDKKIELNNKINQELEIMAKTLYDYWFVQFDFPNEDGKPYKSSGGEMVYNKELKREIPKGWEVIYLDDVLEFEKGIEPGSSNYKEIPTNKNDIPFFKVADMDGKAKTYIDKNLVQNALVKEDDILVSFDGTVGKIAIGLNGSYSSGIRKIYQKEKLFFPKSFIYEVFKSEEIQQTIKKYATGSNILHAGSSIKNLKIAYNEKLVKQYDLIVKSIFKKLIINIQQNKELSNLRDWLLPMLMNGQVKVR